MKKATLSRILGLALALVLALSTSVAFALPSGTSAIEGLPEMPTVPTMTTAAKGYDVTVTLSEPLAWLNAIQNWNWLPITMSDDGLTGTYNTKGLSSQLGYATWKNGYEYDYMYPVIDGEAVPEDEFIVDKENHEQRTVATRPSIYGPGFLAMEPGGVWRDLDGKVNFWYYSDYIETSEDDEETEEMLWHWVDLAKEELYIEYQDDEEVLAALDTAGSVTYEQSQEAAYVKVYVQQFGTYDQGNDLFKGTNGEGDEYSLGYAYNGATNDGTNVYYGRYGEVVQVSKDLTGVNFLGTDKTPVKTTVTWIPLEHYGKKAWNYYIYTIVEEYEDGSKLTAKFSSSMGGKLVGTKAE